MKEMEVKVLNIEPENIEKKLISLGAHKVKDEKQINMIFDTNELYLEKKFKGYSRIRIVENFITGDMKSFFTLKMNIKSLGSRENVEHEVLIDNPKEMEKILEALGYELKYKGVKMRTSYKYENILFEIDIWDKETYPYPYLEIEVEREEDVTKAINLLEIDKSRISLKSIQELRRELEKKS
jgi:adenylate cyclase class 2